MVAKSKNTASENNANLEASDKHWFENKIKFVVVGFFVSTVFILPVALFSLFLFSDLHDGFVPFPELSVQEKIRDGSVKEGYRPFADQGLSKVCVLPRATKVRHYHRQFDRDYHSYELNIYVLSQGQSDRAFYTHPATIQSEFLGCTTDPANLILKEITHGTAKWQIYLEAN